MLQYNFQPSGSCCLFYETYLKFPILFEGKQPCVGESGAPLFMRNSGERSPWYLAGIDSFGSNRGCKEAPIPEAYTRVSAYADWIASKMEEDDDEIAT